MHETHLTERPRPPPRGSSWRTRAATRVTRISVRLGALSHFDPGHFREHFADSAAGTVADGAEVDAEVDPDPTAPGAQGVLLESVELDLEGSP